MRYIYIYIEINPFSTIFGTPNIEKCLGSLLSVPESIELFMGYTVYCYSLMSRAFVSSKLNREKEKEKRKKKISTTIQHESNYTYCSQFSIFMSFIPGPRSKKQSAYK